MTRAIVIGAGVGGLAAAAVLARAGLEVIVLEAQGIPGGCASTFFHQGYRFDAGATLTGGFTPGGPMERVARAAGIDAWPAAPAAVAMVVHLPDSAPVYLPGHWECAQPAAPVYLQAPWEGTQPAAPFSFPGHWEHAQPAAPFSLPGHGAGAQPGANRSSGDGSASREEVHPAVQIPRMAPGSHRDEERPAFRGRDLDFFRWQERTAQAMWDLALRLPPWPPQSPAEVGAVLSAAIPWLLQGGTAAHAPALALDAFRPVAAHLRQASDRLRLFVDAQLLISAQATSERANALYGAAALDLPRRGVVHLRGGMGAIAETLVEAVRRHGGRVLYRQEVTRIRTERGRPVAVETKRGDSFAGDLFFANLTPWNAAGLMPGELPPALRRLPPHPPDGWGAFVVYVGLDGAAVPAGFPLHHQIVVRRPLGEGNSVFASLSPAWDASRAPTGDRALTLSTHTRLAGWGQLYAHDRPAYEARKAETAEKLLAAAETALPGLRRAARLVLPGTPVTFEHFTRRKWGWVGGFPQTSLLRAFGPRLAPNLWLVGDSIFPGQSTAAVALGGLRAAEMALAGLPAASQ